MASPELHWNPAPTNTALSADEVQVWCVVLDLPASRAEELFRMLSQDEQQRAELFKFQKGRDHFIVGRATLRRLLGNALKLDPAALTFSYGPRGKPELAGAAAGQLHFNVSHSGGLALVALTRRCPVGVDIEHDRPSTMGTEIAERFFTQRENAGLMQLPEARRAAAFINLWTRKEAWLKATGDGIATWLKRVEVSFLPGEPACVLAVDDLPEEPACWTLADLRPATGYTGAMAIRAHDLNVRCWCWVE